MSSNPVINVQNFSLELENQTILEKISFDIEYKSILSIVGPSGSGKSSLLHCINRLVELQPCCKCDGQILFQGKPVSSFSPNFLRKQIGLIQQKPTPLPFSILENFRIPLKEHGVNEEKLIQTKMEASLKKVGLWEEVHNKLKSSALKLSGGQQQRLCIARAIALEPKVLLMDEPCSALDPISSQRLESLIFELSSTISIVIVTHNLAQARRLKGKTLMIWSVDGKGKILESGTTEEVLESPKHPLAQKYVLGALG